jgi:hypothetical protein
VQHKQKHHEEQQEEVLLGGWRLERHGVVFAGDSNGELKGNLEVASVQRFFCVGLGRN